MAEAETTDFITRALQHWAVITNMVAVFGLGVAVPAMRAYSKYKLGKRAKKNENILNVSKQVVEPIIERIDTYMEIQSEQNEAIIHNLETINKKLDKLLRDYDF